MSDTYKVYLYTICQIYQNVCNLINVYIYPTIHVNTNNGIVSKRYTDLIIFVFIVLTYMLANIYSARTRKIHCYEIHSQTTYSTNHGITMMWSVKEFIVT